jgi:hypothetical protein
VLAAGEMTAHGVQVARTTWRELDPRVRRVILVVGAVESLLKVAALIDLGRRRSADVRGSKARWAAAITLINAAGAAPIVYFRYGRRR